MKLTVSTTFNRGDIVITCLDHRLLVAVIKNITVTMSSEPSLIPQEFYIVDLYDTVTGKLDLLNVTLHVEKLVTPTYLQNSIEKVKDVLTTTTSINPHNAHR